MGVKLAATRPVNSYCILFSFFSCYCVIVVSIRVLLLVRVRLYRVRDYDYDYESQFEPSRRSISTAPVGKRWAALPDSNSSRLTATRIKAIRFFAALR